MGKKEVEGFGRFPLFKSGHLSSKNRFNCIDYTIERRWEKLKRLISIIRDSKVRGSVT